MAGSPSCTDCSSCTSGEPYGALAGAASQAARAAIGRITTSTGVRPTSPTVESTNQCRYGLIAGPASPRKYEWYQNIAAPPPYTSVRSVSTGRSQATARLGPLRRPRRGGNPPAATGSARGRGARPDEALGLWRGSALHDVYDVPAAQSEVLLLEELRLTAILQSDEAALRLGRAAELIPQLTVLTARHPFHERFHAQLMRALTGSSRRAEALATYQHARRTLARELGVEPGPELRAVEAQILHGKRRPQLCPALSARRPQQLSLRRAGAARTVWTAQRSSA